MASGETHRYTLSLKAGSYARLTLRQFEVDAYLRITAPDGVAVVELNSHEWAVESYSLVATAAGEYGLEVLIDDDDSTRGEYRLSASEPSPARPTDLESARAQGLLAAELVRSPMDPARLREAVAAAAAGSDRRLEAVANQWLSIALHRQGALAEAIPFEKKALALWSALGDQSGAARSYRELGILHGRLGDKVREARFSRASQRILLAAQDRRLQILALRNAAGDLSAGKRHSDAIRDYRKVIALAESIGAKHRAGVTLEDLVGALVHAGRFDEAIDAARKHLQFQLERSDPAGEATAFGTLGTVLHLSGDYIAAERPLQVAVAMRRMLGDRTAEASTLFCLASNDFRRALFESAARRSAWGLRLFDSVFDDTFKPSWRAGTSDRGGPGQLDLLLVRSLLRLSYREPGQDWGIKALLHTDRSRAGYLHDSESLALDSIRDHLLDDQTALVEYFIDGEESAVFVVTSAGLSITPLPGDHQLGPITEAIATGRGTKARDAMARLSSMILMPIADQIRGKRLLISPHGVLQNVPFGALPDPSHSTGALLIDRHEIVYIPSATAITELAIVHARRARPSGGVAIVADPVFQRTDSRVSNLRGGEGRNAEWDEAKALVAATRAVGMDSNGFGRLLHTRWEAQKIRSHVRDAQIFQGTEALKTLLTEGKLRSYRILHFATHSLMNPADPDASGMVLSLFGRDGKPISGFLTFPEIYNGDFPADLVVLSSCQTAVGRDHLNIGMLTLAGAFLHAGARAVVSSLWKVDDEATAALMTAFYEEMFQKNKQPVAALRAAQLKVRAVPRWRSPYYWGGFILQGQWR